MWGEGAGNIHLLSNAYYNGGYKYATSAPAGRYNIYQNTHTWARASSGTADAAATFTESMRLDSSGRLLVGSTTTWGSQPSTIQIKGPGGTAIGVTLISGNDENAGGLYLTVPRLMLSELMLILTIIAMVLTSGLQLMALHEPVLILTV